MKNEKEEEEGESEQEEAAEHGYTRTATVVEECLKQGTATQDNPRLPTSLRVSCLV